MIGFIKRYKIYLLGAIVGFTIGFIVNHFYQAGKNKEKLKNLEVENAQVKKAHEAEVNFNNCVAKRGASFCMRDNFERKD
jgi:uncharacterized membrane protein YraQ (UPF0718 family)